MTVAEFIAKWKRSDLKERSAAQEHFIDLSRLVGQPAEMSDEQILERLLQMNTAKAMQEGRRAAEEERREQNP